MHGEEGRGKTVYVGEWREKGGRVKEVERGREEKEKKNGRED